MLLTKKAQLSPYEMSSSSCLDLTMFSIEIKAKWLRKEIMLIILNCFAQISVTDQQVSSHS